MRCFTCIILLISSVLLISCEDKGQSKISIQPYEGVSLEDIALIKEAIELNYGAKVYLLKEKGIPQDAFVNIKSPRYRAEKIIAKLKQEKPDSIDFLLGITNKDISTSKKNSRGEIKKPKWKYEDWGIFGLGYRPGPSCVVSTYRLNGNLQKRSNRLVKISLHELGHNMGLRHCDRDPNCVMRDAAESIKTIDNVSKNLCKFCRKDIE